MITWVYSLTVALFTRIIGLFFRATISRGSWQIPAEGPVVFVVAPHANQFVDPLILLRHTRRIIGFLVARKSWDRPLIGWMARLMHSIPVSRSQDYAHPGSGLVTLADSSNGDGLELHGVDTEFTRQLHVGDAVVVKVAGKPSVSMDVASVLSDTRLSIKRRPADDADIRNSAYTILPHVDQSQMFESVFTRLSHGECVGIFPEGGSHDRAEMLPLKAGVSIMVLGAMAAHPGLDVKIVPCGLNYFAPHRFRSRAVIEFGAPLSVSPELVELYARGGASKREACGKLLVSITEALQSVTVNAPDWDTLQAIQAARRLYKPKTERLSLSQVVMLTRRFAQAYEQTKDHQLVRDFRRNVIAYNRLLETFGIRDHQVEKTAVGWFSALRMLIVRLVKLMVLISISLPGTLLNIPVIILTETISKRKAFEAKKASTVKIAGRDVLATWKLLVALVLIPSLYSFYAVLGLYVIRLYGYFELVPSVMIVAGLVLALSLLSYVTMRLGESAAEIFTSLSPLLLTLSPGNEHASHRLRQYRRVLQTDVMHLVDELGPTVFENFDDERIVEREHQMRLKLLDQLSASQEVNIADDALDWKSVSKLEQDDIFFSSSSPKLD